jgi:uncharacterized delta-60 repeat protein
VRIPNNGMIKLNSHLIGKPGGRVRIPLLSRAGLAFLIALVALFGSISASYAGSKIVVAGTANQDFGVARYNWDGSPDTTFNPGGALPPYTEGVVTTDISGFDQCYAVAIQSDGKIVAVGYSGLTDFAVVRYNTDGSLDTTTFNPTGSFGGPPNSPGMVTTEVGTYDYGYAVAIQVIASEEKIVVAGVVSGANNDLGVLRYNSDGSLDDTFDSDGIVTTDFNSTDDQAWGVAVQPADNKIVAVGNSGNDFAVVRYNSDGSLDDTFDSDGKVTTDLGTSGDYGKAVAIQSNGKIVVTGYNNNDFGVVRYNSNGSLDTTFNPGGMFPPYIEGILTTSLGTSDLGYGVAIQSNGKIVAAGRANMGNLDFGVVRYNFNGSPDLTFDSDGKVITDFSGTGSSDSNYAVASVGDKIIVAGVTDVNGNFDFGIVRYNSDGSLDDTFDSDGIVATPVSASGTDTARGIALQVECDSQDWWDPAYAYRRQLDIDEAVSGYSMKLTLDDTTTPTAADIYNECIVSGNDFRVVWYNGCVWIELDRELESFDSSNITVWFRIQEPDGWAGGPSNYWLYYGNSSPDPVKEDKSFIYDLSDDFDNWDNWTRFTEETYKIVTYYSTASGGPVSGTSVTSASVLPNNNNLLLAVVATSPASVTVSSITGISTQSGWTSEVVKTSGSTRMQVFSAISDGSLGAATANLSGSATNATIFLARFGNVDTSDPIGNFGSAGQTGVTTEQNYSIPLTTTLPRAMAYGAASANNTGSSKDIDHTPGSGYSNEAQNPSGTGGPFLLASEVQSRATPNSNPVTGTLTPGDTKGFDWAAVALEIKPAPPNFPAVTASGTLRIQNVTTSNTVKQGVFHNSFTTNNSYGFAIKQYSRKVNVTYYHGVGGWYHTGDEYGPAGSFFYAGETKNGENRYVLSNGTDPELEIDYDTTTCSPTAGTWYTYETFVKPNGAMKFTRDGATCFPPGGIRHEHRGGFASLMRE